ncbi:hypothetical protein OCH239_12860 [Roseivivax halodurans JCM 10272]|uniref:Uncharacterized protein n=1 Tax=Roseivivax halodurans JCM 10272 TaxID=1449350 RepID=X7EB71_9RHOB|nr:hypothetical protein OCH239_12860 [Roseivivax halodurans JCM 10272]
MMGPRQEVQPALFYEFLLEDLVQRLLEDRNLKRLATELALELTDTIFHLPNGAIAGHIVILVLGHRSPSHVDRRLDVPLRQGGRPDRLSPS